MSALKQTTKGILYALAGYMIWGFNPIYFHYLKEVPAYEIVAHRAVWSFVFIALLLAARREFTALRAALSKRLLLIYLGIGILLGMNWLIYIWAITSGYIVESSLGYFITPLLNILMGVLFLREKMRPLQWLPVGLAGLGLIYLAVSYGHLPWVALVLGSSFAIYGLVKKLAPLRALQGMAVETAVLLLPSLIFLGLLGTRQAGAFVHAGSTTTLLLVLAGVITASPLLLFSAGVQLVPLSTIGFLQYVSPTMQFLTGIFLFNEPFDTHKLIGFCLVWLGLLFFIFEGFIIQRKKR